jgi:hypothetical protein
MESTIRRMTITRIFILPTIVNINKKELKENGFINCFIADNTSDIKYEDCIFLLFKPEFPGRFRKFLNREYDRTRSIVADYDKFRGMTVLVYKLNKDFLSDYELIRKSQYSKTSKRFKDIFPEYVEVLKDGISRKELSLQYRIFNKTPDLVKYWKDRNANFNEDKEIWYDFVEKNEALSNEILNEAALLNFE